MQKSYLIDTILQGLPIPELYMLEKVDTEGNETHVVVDGQQRIRACLDYVGGTHALDGDDVAGKWRGLMFNDLTANEKQTVFAYKFVVRVLPTIPMEELRRIFARLNRNVVALNDQELRNATYWGPFIQAIQRMADEDEFWSESGVFSANDHRRMLDHEFISELAAAFLHGPQNKKDKLDDYYQLHEERFERRDELLTVFRKTTGEIAQLLPQLPKTRWRKKSDFYTLFLALLARFSEFPMASDKRDALQTRIVEFGEGVDVLTRLDEQEWGGADQEMVNYARNVVRAASDRGSRISRGAAFEAYSFK